VRLVGCLKRNVVESFFNCVSFGNYANLCTIVRFIIWYPLYRSGQYNKFHELIFYDVNLLLPSNSNVAPVTPLLVNLKTF